MYLLYVFICDAHVYYLSIYMHVSIYLLFIGGVVHQRRSDGAMR